MATPVVAVVDAKTPGNVGTIARAMKNFGFADLLLVDPPELDPDGEAYGYAGQAREDVLPAAREIDFETLVSSYHTVGFTSVTNEDDSKHVRFPYATPAELATELAGVETETALVFGRERIGLTNDELASVDQICAIPASEEYPSLNLGQAATVALYELRDLAMDDSQLPERARTRATEREIEGFYDHFETLLDDIEYPAEKHDKTMRLVRRLLGRAHPTGREIATLRGVLRKARRRFE
ncbi:tRNA C32,U32 (ribose-2'-O)-methylase TrmJ or a related methyltransferase [Halanaeroarchaeum sp. HSR-CO]|uniref:RNA methyltransferase n=1 Tax=Halanaeroarchaeum sp. HSR-CO TaxID=2866382 RepID=UPI00217D9E1B|nr:RNA methyltransferase [Halanaeroarchaeum sp. HSR-CO]UWG47882.1 tRNA C32,U32 (ribose-2'-O)-methylase TrmJ or a related methyltransferase [Halanaeroarchaeum sp. HSR-CO]